MAEDKRTWTPDQEKAMNTRDKTLLVSAAAGSGKTATLTERIIRSILDDDNPVSIKDMLIVTFTNSAVGELRERISAAIKAAAAAHPENMRLEEELLTVRDAKIMTIDAFCNSILKSCASSVGLPPNYRIGDEAELSLLSDMIMDGLINACYEGEAPEIASAMEFSYFAECLTTAKTEGTLCKVLLTLYESTQSTENGIDSLLPLIEEYDPARFTTVDATRFGGYIMDEVRQAFGSYRRVYGLLDTISLSTRAYEGLSGERAGIDRVLNAGTFSEMRSAILDLTPISMQGIKVEKTEEYLHIKCIRNLFKADLERFKASYFAYAEQDWLRLYTDLYGATSLLYRLLKKFDSLLIGEKHRRGLCSYGDIERYAYMALWRDGEKTDYARELAAGFKAIYIDEYQDVNNLQNKIFEAVASDSNRFMVGDIKQSIYGFRSARPEIFAEMKQRFPKLENADGSSSASIFMSANFRCDKEIVDFTNDIFNRMFGVMGKSIGYQDDDALAFCKLYKPGEIPRGNIPEVHIIEKSSKSKASLADASDSAIEDAVIAEDTEAIRIAADAVAQRIGELLENGIKANGEPFAPSDIAIILRFAKGKSDVYREALEAKGIRAAVAGDGEFLNSEEVLLTLALLNTVDNPRRDIYLAALLMSPLFGFTPDDLVLIRRCSSDEALYGALVEYCGLHPDFSKGHRFLDKLNRYRSLAEGISIDSLLSLLYRETGLLSLAERNGGRENLILLQSYAKNYESSSFKGLYSFISYINNIISEEKKFDTGAGSVEDGNAVKIITAHKSKGLEFPACFFAEAQAPMRKSSSDRIEYAEDFGVSMLLKDPSGISLVNSPVHNVIKRFNSEKEYEEELRVLYVILTRAREALFVFSTASSTKHEEALERVRILGEELDGYLARRFSSMFEVIEATRKTGRMIFHALNAESEGAAQSVITEQSPVAPAPASSPESIRRDADELLARFSFSYPDEHMTRLPEKLSVSRLYPEILDGRDDGAIRLEALVQSAGSVLTDTESADFKPYLPKFISGVEADESAKRGIATHTFMQFCDFKALVKGGAEDELKRLVEGQFLSKEDGERVRINEIEAFIDSPLFLEMKNAKRLHRELRFNVKFPAAQFTSDDDMRAALRNEEILVQGVIDCIIEREDGSLHLVDYKTDRLTAEERRQPELAEKRLREAHSLQLSYYKHAARALFGRAPCRVGIYSLHLGKEVDV